MEKDKKSRLGPKATVAAIAILALLIGILLAQCSGAETPPGGNPTETPGFPAS